MNNFKNIKSSLPSHKELWMAFLLTGILTIFEVVGAWRSHSLALVVEVVHFIADTWAFGVALYSLTQNFNNNLSFDHEKMLEFAVLINAIMQIIIGVWVMLEACIHLTHPEHIESGWMLIVAVVGFVINIFLMRWFGGFHFHKDHAIEGVRIHFLSDAGLCGATVLAAIGIWLWNLQWIDAFLALIASLIMIGSAVFLGRKVIRKLNE